MTALISGREVLFSRLSFRLTRVVPRSPLTLALTRLDCFEASNQYTLLAGTSLARAIPSTAATVTVTLAVTTNMDMAAWSLATITMDR